MVLEAVLLVSVSLFGSALLPTLTNGVVVFSLFGLAWLAGVVEFIGGAMANEAMVNLGIAVSLVIPSDAVWRGASYYIQSPLALTATGAAGIGMPFGSNAPPAPPMIAWALAYPLLFLLGTILAFARRDV
jgi:Cu-processing system permease protein